MPLVDWNSIEEEQLNPQVSRKAIHVQNLTIARIHLQPHAFVAEHHHAHEQVAMVERGVVKFVLDGREQLVRAGQALTIPPNAPHSAEALEDSIVVDVFSPARDDWQRGDDAYLRR